MLNICPFCHSPSNNSANAINCSNKDCWKSVIAVLANSKPIDTAGDTWDNPITYKCPTCNTFAHLQIPFEQPSRGRRYFCFKCRWLAYDNYRIGKWYFSCHYEGGQIIGGYVYRYTGKDNDWDYSAVKQFQFKKQSP